jgi:hypothetical protein
MVHGKDQTERLWHARRSTGDRLPPVYPVRLVDERAVFPTRRAAAWAAVALLKIAAALALVLEVITCRNP